MVRGFFIDLLPLFIIIILHITQILPAILHLYFLKFFLLFYSEIYFFHIKYIDTRISSTYYLLPPGDHGIYALGDKPSYRQILRNIKAVIYNRTIVLKLNKCLGRAAAKAPIKLQDDMILTTNPAAFLLCDILRKD